MTKKMKKDYIVWPPLFSVLTNGFKRLLVWQVQKNGCLHKKKWSLNEFFGRLEKYQKVWDVIYKKQGEYMDVISIGETMVLLTPNTPGKMRYSNQFTSKI